MRAGILDNGGPLNGVYSSIDVSAVGAGRKKGAHCMIDSFMGMAIFEFTICGPCWNIVYRGGQRKKKKIRIYGHTWGFYIYESRLVTERARGVAAYDKFSLSRILTE